MSKCPFRGPVEIDIMTRKKRHSSEVESTVYMVIDKDRSFMWVMAFKKNHAQWLRDAINEKLARETSAEEKR